MKVDKISISFEAGLGDQVRTAARKAGAAAVRLRADALGDYLDAWEKKHGTLTPAELRRAEAELGLDTGRKTRR